MSNVIGAVLALFPVFVFLAALVLMDSYKLVGLRSIVAAIIAGGVVALACYYVNVYLSSRIDLPPSLFSRYIAPAVEEIGKSLYLVYLFRAKRIGFMVDAAVCGFAIGAGFAFVENVYYLQATVGASMLTWVVRGFGTAAMHGGTVAIFGIVSRTLADRLGGERLIAFLPGLALAYAIHSLFNHFILPPILSTAMLLVTLPLTVAAVFYQSERATQRWLGTGIDSDMELLELITSGRISTSHIGTYLENLRHRFPMEVVVDMLCYLRLHLELALQAKGLIMMRQAGLTVPPDPELEARFAELKHLEGSIGATGKLAILPFLRTTSRDMWQIYMLARSEPRQTFAASE